MNIEFEKERIRIPEVWEFYNLPGICPDHGLISSPIREDKKPSLSIFDKGRRFKDHATGQGGDVISFMAYVRDIPNSEATKEFRSIAAGGEHLDGKTHHHRASAPAASKPTVHSKDWPDLIRSESGCQALAELRSLDLRGVIAAQDSGCLRFTTWKGHSAWVICDEEQQVVQARRLDGKPWSEIDSKSWNLPGSKGGIVGLHQLDRESTNARVVLVEGGPDYLAATSCCLRAHAWTTNQIWIPIGILGAGRQLDTETVEKLQGRKILIFAHADESGAGLEAAKRWSQDLAESGSEVEVVLAKDIAAALENPRIADLNDLFRFASVSEVEEVLKSALSKDSGTIPKHIFHEPFENQSKFDAFKRSIVTAGALAKMTVEPKRRILGQWFREADIGILYAPRGLGKTWMVNLVAKAISAGEGLGEWESGEGSMKVLIIDGEMSLQQTQERYRLLGMEGERIALLHHEHLFKETDQSINIAEKENQEAILKLVQDCGFNVVIFDNLSTLSSGLKENDSDDWEMMSPWLIKLRRFNVAVVQVAHANKSGSLRGTSRKEDATNWIMALKPDGDVSEKDGACFISKFEKNRNCTELEAPQLRWFIRKGDPVTVECTKQSRLDLLLALIAGGVSSNLELAEEMGVSKGTISKMAKKLEDGGQIRIEGGKYFPTF